VGGTAPALSAGSARVTKEAMRVAKRCGLAVSFDLNYRSKLWPIERARKAYAELLACVDILILGEGDPSRIFGMKGADYRESGRRLADKFGIKVLVVTRREDITVLRNNWTAEALADGRWHEDVTYSLEIVDRVGGGDAFTGGFLYGYLRFGRDVGRSLQYGNASCALKHAIPGDVSWSTLEEVEDLIRRGPGGGTGLRIRR